MGLRFTLAITGASGSAFGVAMLKRMSANAAVDHIALLLSPTGKRCLLDETGLTPKDLAAFPKVSLRDERDLGADISSGSCRHDGMVIIPCSAGALGRIASGVSEPPRTGSLNSRSRVLPKSWWISPPVGAGGGVV